MEIGTWHISIMKNLLRYYRKRKNLTLKELAGLTGYALSTVQKHELGERDMNTAALDVYAKALGISPAVLLGSALPADNVDAKPTKFMSHKNSVNEADELTVKIASPTIRANFGDGFVPIFGHAQGTTGDAMVLNTSEPLGVTPRHPLQEGAVNAFAVYAKDDSMAPRYKAGELVYAVSRKPPMAGQDCIIELGHGESFIKEYVRQTDKELICRQYNPAKEWRRPLEKIKAIHAVVGRG